MLLPNGMHDVEAWSEAVGGRCLGKAVQAARAKRSGPPSNLDHWACFQQSYRQLEQLVTRHRLG